MRAPSTDAGHAYPPVRVSASVSPLDRPTAVTIDLGALSHNYGEVRRRIGNRHVLAVVKAQAYGHGAVPVATRLAADGARMLGVALVEEGCELRDAGITAPVLVMGPVFPEQAEAVVGNRLTPVVSTLTLAQALSAEAPREGRTVSVHVKIDTGMGRIGLSPEAALPFIAEISALPGIAVEGLMTHFADADLRDKRFAAVQMDRFEALIEALAAKGIAVPLRHAANSAAVLEYDRALLTMVRPGLMLYGADPLESKGGADLRPVLSWTTRVAFVKQVPTGTPISYGRTFTTSRQSTIATIPVGYADGYSRSLSNRGAMLVRGMRAPVAGRVCMDMTMLDVTAIPGVREGDEVVLLGAQGTERISADDIAALTGTIAYEVLCGIGGRVPRILTE
jgi:alanine racemase